jgi:hypothetical protein
VGFLFCVFLELRLFVPSLQISYINVQNKRAKILSRRKRERERLAKLWECRGAGGGGGGESAERKNERKKKDRQTERKNEIADIKHPEQPPGRD